MIPDKPLYFTQFIDSGFSNTVLAIATFGWCLIDDSYEQAIYRAAIIAMQRVVRRELPESTLEAVYGGQYGDCSMVWFYDQTIDKNVDIVLN